MEERSIQDTIRCMPQIQSWLTETGHTPDEVLSIDINNTPTRNREKEEVEHSRYALWEQGPINTITLTLKNKIIPLTRLFPSSGEYALQYREPEKYKEQEAASYD